MYIGEDIKKQREARANNIVKGFSNSDDLLEKAHNHGDVHSNGKWYWESSANGKIKKEEILVNFLLLTKMPKLLTFPPISFVTIPINSYTIKILLNVVIYLGIIPISLIFWATKIIIQINTVFRYGLNLRS